MMQIARILLILGITFIVLGGIAYLAARVNLPLGRLPGDIRIQNENFTCLFPRASSIILSLLLTIVLNVIVRLLNR